ncbi:MAG: thioredoxin domain-containing protein, partial [Ignavibacteriaceae bacterium]|nr:thioredoxin domain-containing protein [Ignavibacteriaceae bacterium]
MNRLSSEKSPYLLQHKNNPVNWFPWGNEAFEKAKAEDKPLFLSIGYSTCHWCHVMEKESFEDETVAQLMNEAFISIKVDREERPDIDGIYMTVCQMLTGSGGWPLTIIMTPDKKPFFAGTYFPKESRYGRMGMVELVPKIKNVWEERREDINQSVVKILESLTTAANNNSVGELTLKISEIAFNQFKQRFDEEFGGFGSAPKFPSLHNLLFLLRYYKRTGNIDALSMVEKTLTEMYRGGIYDQVGFGFHRYSTDERWLVPHFEKMLYDQAMLAIAFTEMYQVSKNPLYKKTVEEILEYVKRDLTAPEGGFYSAEDADSEGEEGKFYLWTTNEIAKNFNSDDAEFIKKIFNLKTEGNWIDPMEGSLNGTNILHLKKSISELSAEFQIPESELQKKIIVIREKLFNIRAARVHPSKDDKVLADWNSLMISAFAKASAVFNNSVYLSTAKRAAGFILENMLGEDERLLHRWRLDEAGLPAHIDDYAFFIAALLDVYEASFDIYYFELALRFADKTITHFWDNENGGFFFTADDGEELLIRQKDIYDGAIPSGNSVMLTNLLRLGRMTGNISFEEKASQIIKAFSAAVEKSPIAYSQFLCGVEFARGGSQEIVLTSKVFGEQIMEYLALINSKYIPN